NNMPPRISAATARAAAAARAVAAAAAPMTAAAVEQLIEARVSVALANQETLRNITNGHGDESHNSGIRNRGTTRTPRKCTYKDFLNYHPLNFKGTDITSYTLRFQELALMCGRMFPEESDKVEKYVGGLPDMIWGNVMSYRP
ncbi:hypothetical protein Tco_0048824, partial [Tanacetum coccineum]